MRFRKPFRLLVIAAALAWMAVIATYVGLVLGHTLTPAAPTASLSLMLGVGITTTVSALVLRILPSAVAAWTLGYIEGREDHPEPATEGATLLRLVGD